MGKYASTPAQSDFDVLPMTAEDCTTTPATAQGVSSPADSPRPRAVSSRLPPGTTVPPKTTASKAAAPTSTCSETASRTAVSSETPQVVHPRTAAPDAVTHSNEWNFMKEWLKASPPGSVHNSSPTQPRRVATSSDSMGVHAAIDTAAAIEQPGARAEALKESIKQLADSA